METAQKEVLLNDFFRFKELLKRFEQKKVEDPLHTLMTISEVMHNAYPDADIGYNPKYMEAMNKFIDLLPDK